MVIFKYGRINLIAGIVFTCQMASLAIGINANDGAFPKMAKNDANYANATT